MKNSILIFIFCAYSTLTSANNLHLKTFDYHFSKKENFQVGFADYPKGQEADYELEYKQAARLPKEIKNYRQGLKISGNNHSDDLFMYAYKKICGLKPNHPYAVRFVLEFASNASQGTAGTGGSPGDSVYVKIGAVATRPQRIVDSGNLYRINLDKGDQGIDGKDLILIGTIGVPTEKCYKLKTLRSLPNTYQVTTNARGEVWLIFGTDSGFESTTTLFYTHLRVSFDGIPAKP